MPVHRGASVHGLIAAVACITALGSIACDEPLSTLAGPTPDLQPTFVSVQAPVFWIAIGAPRN